MDPFLDSNATSIKFDEINLLNFWNNHAHVSAKPFHNMLATIFTVVTKKEMGTVVRILSYTPTDLW